MLVDDHTMIKSISNLLAKLGGASRTEAVTLALRKHIIS